jgi:hypothetical protein
MRKAEATVTAGPKPLTRQRSPWVEGDAAEVGGRAARRWVRLVHDGRLQAFLTLDPAGWHLSVSHAPNSAKAAGRYPTWDELADARYALAPADIDMVMHLPPPADYVAVHPTCFHLHEHPERALS